MQDGSLPPPAECMEQYHGVPCIVLRECQLPIPASAHATHAAAAALQSMCSTCSARGRQGRGRAPTLRREHEPVFEQICMRLALPTALIKLYCLTRNAETLYCRCNAGPMQAQVPAGHVRLPAAAPRAALRVREREEGHLHGHGRAQVGWLVGWSVGHAMLSYSTFGCCTGPAHLPRRQCPTCNHAMHSCHAQGQGAAAAPQADPRPGAGAHQAVGSAAHRTPAGGCSRYE